jgi:hypothetical protein
MFFSAPLERLYQPLIATWWLGVVTCMHVWAGLAASSEPKQSHLRLVTENGKLVD